MKKLNYLFTVVALVVLSFSAQSQVIYFDTENERPTVSVMGSTKEVVKITTEAIKARQNSTINVNGAEVYNVVYENSIYTLSVKNLKTEIVETLLTSTRIADIRASLTLILGKY